MNDKYSAIRERFKEGDWIIGTGERNDGNWVILGEQVGASPVTYLDTDTPQPFSYLDTTNPDDFRFATDAEIEATFIN